MTPQTTPDGAQLMYLVLTGAPEVSVINADGAATALRETAADPEATGAGSCL